MHLQIPSDSVQASIEALLPNGGWVISMQACFDEGGNGNSSITCVAGYFFRDADLPNFQQKWREILNGRRFHMVDLVHGHEDFETCLELERDAIARNLIATIKDFMTLGVVISVDHSAYDIAMAEHDLRKDVGSPYTMCAMLCLSYAARWMQDNTIPREDTVYFFEKGNTKRHEADDFLEKIESNSDMDIRYRYVSHGFVKKNKLAALDAADLLAWEWIQQCKRITGEEKRPTRASLRSLVEKPHIGDHINRKNIQLALAMRLVEPYVIAPEKFD